MSNVKAHTHRSEPRRGHAKRTIGHRLFATTRPVDPMYHDEDDYDQDAPKLSLSKVFLVILLLHVLVIFGLVVMNMDSKSASSFAGITGEKATAASLASPGDEALAQRNAERLATDESAPEGSLDAASVNASPNDRLVPLAPPGLREVQPPPQGWDTVEVRSGENIGDIARRVGVQQRWLVRGNLELNRLSSESAAVRVGQVLAVPSAEAIETYLVEERLAERRAGAAQAPVEVTPVAETPAVEAVAAAPASTPAPVEAAPLAAASPTEPAAATGGSEHVVAPGETFYRIAVNHGVSVDALMQTNGYEDPATLRVGDRLTIP